MNVDCDGFKQLGIADWLCRHIASVGFKYPTNVQKSCIPPILEGRNCIGCAKTGSGKTAAFALPIIQRLAQDPYGVFAIVVTPTRELAIQLSEQINVFGKIIGAKTAVIIGGKDTAEQSSILIQSPHIVIGTPGRLAFHLTNTHDVSLHKMKFLVLDEADFLLRFGFSADLEKIIHKLPNKRQTILFSATMTETMKKLFATSNKDVFTWNISMEMESGDEVISHHAYFLSTCSSVDKLCHKYILTPAQVKSCYFIELLQMLLRPEPQSMIVFTHTCRSCHVYSELLQRHNVECVTLHSLLTQTQRCSAISKFKSGLVNVLVATDIASRGLDIPEVSYVINLNVPASPVDYIHRVGRTARSGKNGVSVTFVTQFDIMRLENIERHIGFKLSEFCIDEKVVIKSLRKIGEHECEIELVFRATQEQNHQR